MKAKQSTKLIAALLVAIFAGIPALQAKNWNYAKTGVKDDGGGTYDFRYDQKNFRYSDDSHWNAEDHIMYFKTLKKFDASKGNYYYDFEVGGCFIEIAHYGKKEWTKTFIEGEIYAVTADDVEHRIGTWSKPKENEKTVTYTSDYNKYGLIRVSEMNTSNGHFTIRYLVGPDAVKEGVKKVFLRQRLTFKDSRVWDWWQYEKDINISAIKEDYPMAKLTAEWGDDGKIHYSANDIHVTNNMMNYRYWLRTSYYYGGSGYYHNVGNVSRDASIVTITEKAGGKVDMVFSDWHLADGAYTLPVYVYYGASYQMDIKEADCGRTGWFNTYEWYSQPYQYTTVKPYTRPESVNVTFDKWKKTNTITWTKRNQAKLYMKPGSDYVDCLTDGKWYVVRYERGKTVKDYVVVGQPLRGDAATLEVVDSEIAYDKEYVYRVVFLPKVLEDKYDEDLANLPGQSASHSSRDLWEERWTSTQMEVPVKLAQDRTDDRGIRLVWEYNVQTQGCEWRIDKHPLGSTTWTTVTTIPVDVKQSTASYLEEGGSVCDPFTYRIMTIINGKELYSDTLLCTLPAGAYISDVRATTGSEEKFVKVKWKVARPGDDDIWFRVLRRPIGGDEWTLLNDEVHGHATEYEYMDENVMAGSYYEYSVEAYGAKCEGQLVQTDRQVAPGFSQARGTITGHISYGTGTAVAGVKVNLVKSSADDSQDQPQFLSRYIEGEGKGLQWTADSAKYAGKLNGQQELTLQLWAKPIIAAGEANAGEEPIARLQRIVRLNNALELGIINSDGEHWQLYAADLSNGGENRTELWGLPAFDSYKFTHIAAVYSTGRWTFYVGTDTLRTATMSVVNTGWNSCHVGIDNADATLSIGGTISSSGTSYRGFVDDIRLWNRALSQKEIETNYTRILGGTDKGLILYWPLDEGIGVRNYAFDIACQDGIYQLNHPEVGINAMPSAIVPDDLGLYGLTDTEGDYIIRGIPFQQGGTNYKLAPQLGVHEFNPNTRSMFIGPTSLTANNIDFEDVSSFPMSGHIYYAGTNVPAEGIELFVDGERAIANGEVKRTDSEGYYEISVPIGEHYVEAKAEGHQMVSGGRFPTRGTFNFDRAMQYDFADSTLVNYVGRVSGGLRNDTISVGFGASNNNIGVATITLKLNNESFSFNCQDDHISDATAERGWQSDTDVIHSHTRTGTGYDAKYIFIETDSLTGEFSAMLPPLKYITKSIRVNNNSDIEFASLPEVDLTNVTQVLHDSIQDSNSNTYNYYKYNTKTVHTYYASPRLEVKQKSVGSERNTPDGIFGLREIKDFVDDFGTTDITDIWTQEDDGTVNYRFDHPLYRMGDRSTFSVYGYEPYVNYDYATPVVDNIPMDGQKITIINELSDEQMVVAREGSEELGLKPGDINDVKSNELVLGDDGRNEFSWRVGFPNIASPYTRQLSMSYKRNGRTREWSGFHAIVLGALNTGTNFVTLGPDFVIMVLRDAPCSNGKTSWTRGHSKTKLDFSSDAWYDDTKLVTSHNAGVSLKTANGIGTAVITEKEVWLADVGGFHITAEVGNQKSRTWTTTVTETVSTTAHNNYQTAPVMNPSAKGDVFIGASLNIIVGDCRRVGLFRDGADAPFTIDLRDAKSIGDSVRTTFMYSAYELENVMIPKWKETRNAMFTFVKSDKEAMDYVNNTGKCVYLCWLAEDSEDLQSDSVIAYRQVAPANIKKGEFYTDSVAWCNDQIYTWKKKLADNEMDKVEAMKKSKYFRKNISFDGLSGYSYTSKLDTTYQKKFYETHHLGGIYGYESNTEVNSAVHFKNNITFSTENGWVHQEADTSYDDNTDDFAEFSYDMTDGNVGTDFSVNIYSSPAGWSDLFSIVAGQSYNPYEGEAKTEYYEPGKHTLQNGTQQMEQPEIRISTDGIVGAKSATLTDVPAGQEAQFTLHLNNNSLTNQGFSFIYNILVLEDANNEGLSVMMDGYPANGRGVYVSQGETVTKIIKVMQTDQSRLDYEGVKIRFVSQFQPAIIFDEVTLNVHFKPSSSPIDLVISEPVVNIEELKRNDGDILMKLTNYDRQFKNLKSVGVQYRYEGNTQWTTIHTYVTNKADSLNQSFSKLPDDKSEVTFRYNMKDDNMFPQGNYTFRAFTTTPYGENPNDAATVYSNEVAVIKDNMAPRQLTTPAPANGILRYGDDMSIEFNEDIVPGYVTDKNIIVTAKLNHQPVQHDVAKILRPFGEEQRTVNPVFLGGDFSIECWMQWLYSGTILQLGTGQFVLSLDDVGHVVASIAGSEVVSKDVLPKNKWIWLVLSYKAADKAFTALAQYDTVTLPLFTNVQVADDVTPSVSYSDDNYLYLGRMDGAIHDLSLFSIYRDVNEAAATKYQAKDNYVYGLANYWPMNEGHGAVAGDTRHTHDFEVNDTWLLDNTNYSLRMDDNLGVEADISRINTSVGDSYAIEMWTSVAGGYDRGDEQVIFENSNGVGAVPVPARNRLSLFLNAQNDWVLRYGQNEQVVVSHEAFPDIPIWNHVALNVVRGQAASFYFNGKRTAVIAERDVPPLEGARLTMGKGMASLSRFDEVRIWHAALSESRLLSNMYNCIDTTDVYSWGLVAYYPFEKAGNVDGVDTKVETLENLAPRPAGVPGASPSGNVPIVPLGEYMLTASTPPLKNAPVETRLMARPVASERKVVINLVEGSSIKARDIEGTTLNITVDKIHDMHGNESLPIKWQAFVQRNSLKWTRDSVKIIKKYGKDYTFDVVIENSGGNTEYYTLYNMPQWLTLVDSERTDNLNPLSKKTLRFRVSPLVAIGNYDVSIGLQGNDEILEPLRIVMMVRGEMPAWSVNPAKYENNMSVVGQIYIDGVLMANSESRLAAFIGNECRGIAAPQLIRGAAYVPLSIYGTAQQEINGQTADLDNGQPITFRIWDATTGVAYTNVNITLPNGTITDTLYFNPKVNYGTFDSPVFFTKSKYVEQPLNLVKGWNWFSLGVEPANSQVSVMFKELTPWNVRIKDQSTGLAYCNGIYWAGNMKQVRVNTMYKMLLSPKASDNAGEDAQAPAITVIGQPVDLAKTPVILGEDWNWIAYLPTKTMTLDEALAGANPKVGDQMKSQTGFAYYSHNGWEGNLQAMESGKGYIYQSTDTKTKSFVYPTPAASSRPSPQPLPAREGNDYSLKQEGNDGQSDNVTTPLPHREGSGGGSAEDGSSFSPVPPTKYPDNMSMVILLTNDGQLVSDAEVAVFIDGECRGVAFADDDVIGVDDLGNPLSLPLYYLLIPGEDSGQPMEIQAAVNGKVLTLCTTLTYSSDANIGTPWEPFTLDINGAQGIGEIVNSKSTNSNSAWYTLQGIRIGITKPSTPGIYLNNGKIVVIK